MISLVPETTPGAAASGPVDRLIVAFRRAAAAPFYRQILEDHGVDESTVIDGDSFAANVPLLDKANTFDRFPIDRLCVGGELGDLAEVLTSSGHGGRFSFGLTTRRQRAEAGAAIDRALDAAFEVRSRRTLAINCLPMGVGFSSAAMTVATTSVREDMATALVSAFGDHYEQIVLVSDPLFVRRLLDHALEKGVDWRRYRVAAVLGEEIFGEHFRSYVAARLGLDADRPNGGYVMSSFGVGELGLHLCFETPATIAVRRAASRYGELARELFGELAVLPMVLAFDPQRTFIEAIAPDRAGYGRLAISLLDPDVPVPLLRYQTGDLVRMLDRRAVERVLERHGIAVSNPLPERMLALAGREKERLPGGVHVGAYKDALYADPAVADRLTGAFRVRGTESGGSVVHVQLVRGASADAAFTERLRGALGLASHAGRAIVWRYHEFPYGMTLDYERKFTYYDPGEPPDCTAV